MIRWCFQSAHGCVPVAPSEDPHRLDERLELGTALGHRAGDVGERVLPARADLDLGGDQLADEMLLERRPGAAACTSSKRFVEVERAGVDERELLLDRDREVRRVLELLARERDLLVR